MQQEWCLNWSRALLSRFKDDGWGDLPLRSKLQWEKLNNREIRTGVGRRVMLVWYYWNKMQSKVIYSEVTSLKAKNKLTGGSLGSLAAWSQYFIINDNKKRRRRRGERRGKWAVCASPTHWTSQDAHNGISSRTLRNSGAQQKAPARQRKRQAGRRLGYLLLVCSALNAPIGWGPPQDSSGFLRVSASGSEAPNGCSVSWPAWAAAKRKPTLSRSWKLWQHSSRVWAGGNHSCQRSEIMYCLSPDKEGTKILEINSNGLAIKGNRIHHRHES